MSFESLIVSNLISRLDSHGFSPTDSQLLIWNATTARYEPASLKTISGQPIVGTGDLTIGSRAAIYAADLAAPSNISVLSAQTTIDGVALASGTTVLLLNQTNAVENGIYVSSGPATVLTRVPGVEIAKRYFYVTGGNTLFNQMYFGVNATPPTIGVTPIIITQLHPQETLVDDVNISRIGGSSVLGAGNLVVSGGAITETTLMSAKASRAITLSTSPQPIFRDPSSTYEATGGHHIGIYDEPSSSGLISYGDYTAASITAATGGNGTTGYGRVWTFWLYDHTSTPDNMVPWNLCRVYKNASGNLLAQVGEVSGTTVTWQTAIAITNGEGMSYVFDVKPVGGRQFVWVASPGFAIGAAVNTVWCGAFAFNTSTTKRSEGTDTLTAAKTVGSGNLAGYYIADVSHYYGPSATNRCIIFTANQASSTSWTLMNVYLGISSLGNTTFCNSYVPNSTYDTYPSCVEFVRFSRDLGAYFFIGSGGSSIYYCMIDLSAIYSSSSITTGSVTSFNSSYAETISVYVPEASRRSATPVFYVARSDTTTTSNIGWIGAYRLNINAANLRASTITLLGSATSNGIGVANDLDSSTVKLWGQSQTDLYMAFRNRSGNTLIWCVKYNTASSSFSNVGIIGANTWSFANDPYGRYNYLKMTYATFEGKPTIECGINTSPIAGSTYQQFYTYSAGNVVYDLENFSGVTEVAIAKDASDMVTGRGGIVHNTGYNLTPGSKYYVQANATLGTTVTTNLAGYALTKNHLYLYN